MKRVIAIVAVVIATAAVDARQGGRGAGPVGGRGGANSAVMLARADRLPVVRQQPPPNLSGIVAPDHAEIDFQIIVSINGEVEHAHVVKPLSSRFVLESALLDAVRRWTFTPATHLSGRPVATLAIVHFAIARGAAAGQALQVTMTVLPMPDVLPRALDAEKLPSTVYRAGASGVRGPTIIIRVNPDDTRDAMARSVVGAVEIEAVVDADGSVSAARVTRPLDPELDRQALIAAGYWLFRPASLGGRDVAMFVTLQIEFRLH